MAVPRSGGTAGDMSGHGMAECGHGCWALGGLLGTSGLGMGRAYLQDLNLHNEIGAAEQANAWCCWKGRGQRAKWLSQAGWDEGMSLLGSWAHDLSCVVGRSSWFVPGIVWDLLVWRRVRWLSVIDNSIFRKFKGACF